MPAGFLALAPRKGQLWYDRFKLLKKKQSITETTHLNLNPLPSNSFQANPKSLALSKLQASTGFNLEVSAYSV